MDFGSILSVGASLLGGAMQGDAAEGAANIQADATNRGMAEQRRQFDLIRSDNAPFREGGVEAMQMLRGFLGLGGAGAGGAGGRPTYSSIYDRLVSELDSAHRAQYGGMSLFDSPDAATRDRQLADLRRGAQAEYDAWKPADGTAVDPYQVYGTAPLNRRFTVQDFWADPVISLGYQTGLDMGTKALRNASPLTTGMDSGAALKELTKFGTDYTGMKAAESQGRFEGEKSNVFNRLMAMVNGGQVANQVNAAAGSNMANNTASLISAQGNAGAASRIAQGNAWGGAMGNISNWWNQNQMVDRLEKLRNQTPFNPSSYVYAPAEFGGGDAWQ